VHLGDSSWMIIEAKAIGPILKCEYGIIVALNSEANALLRLEKQVMDANRQSVRQPVSNVVDRTPTMLHTTSGRPDRPTARPSGRSIGSRPHSPNVTS
jgi:hypothetical protein